MNSTALPSHYFGTHRQCSAAFRLTWLAYSDGSHLVTLCRRVASDSWRQPWQLLSIPLYLWISSHGADGGSARIPHECVHPSLYRSSSPSRSIHSPEHHVIFHPSCSHEKIALLLHRHVDFRAVWLLHNLTLHGQ